MLRLKANIIVERDCREESVGSSGDRNESIAVYCTGLFYAEGKQLAAINYFGC